MRSRSSLGLMVFQIARLRLTMRRIGPGSIFQDQIDWVSEQQDPNTAQQGSRFQTMVTGVPHDCGSPTHTKPNVRKFSYPQSAWQLSYYDSIHNRAPDDANYIRSLH